MAWFKRKTVMRKNFGALAMMSILAVTAEQQYKNHDATEAKHKLKKSEPKQIEPPIQKGMKYYCFRSDGTFKQYERDGAMLKEEVAFSCWSLNDKNAIKKFKSFQSKLG
jgi:hypothetical protein